MGDSPGPLTILGGRSVSALDISRDSSVLPQPGGPCSSKPRTGGSDNSAASDAGTARAASVRRTMAASCASSPPTRACRVPSSADSSLGSFRASGSSEVKGGGLLIELEKKHSAVNHSSVTFHLGRFF